MNMPFSIKNIFKITVGIPLFILISIFLYLLYGSYENLNKSSELKKIFKEYYTLKQLQSTMHSESKIGVLALSKTDENFKNFINRIQKTDNLIKYIYKENLSKDTSAFLDKMKISRQSPNINSFELLYEPYLKINEYLNLEILNKLTDILHHKLYLDIDFFVNYLIYSNNIINKIALQRDYINSILITKTDPNENKFLLNLTLQNTDMDYFLFATNDLKKEINDKLPQNKIDDLFQKTLDLKMQILFLIQNEKFNSFHKEWTQETDKLMLILSKYNETVYQEISSKIQKYEENIKKEIKLYMLALIIFITLLIIFIVNLKRYDFLINYLKCIVENMKEKGHLNKNINFKFDSKKNIQKSFSNIDISINNMTSDINLLKKINDIKNDLLTNIAHEIQAPLQGIISYIDLIEKTYPNNLTSNIKENAKNIFEIAKNIKKSRNLANNEISLNNVDFIPIKEFEKIADMFSLLATEKNINFLIFIDPQLSNYVNGDLVKIKEILINLIDNAIKFTHNGGKVILRIIKMQSEIENDIKIKFIVEDNGKNINIEKIDEIFIKTHIKDKENEKKYMDLGLGISKELLRLMGGNLKFKSDLKNGSKFYFALNLKDLNIPMPLNKFNLKIAILSSKDEEFDTILETYLSVLGVKCKFFMDFKNIKSLNFDAIFIRFDDYSDLKIKSNKPIILSANYKILTSLKEDMDKNIFFIDEPLKFTKISKILQNITCIEKTQKNFIINTKIENINDKFNAKALVLTNDQTMTKLIKYMLSYFCIQTTIVTSAKELIYEYTQLPYDIIFIEIEPNLQMDKNSIKALIEFEKENKINHSPIIAIIDSDAKTSGIYDKNFDDFVLKPIKTNALQRLLNRSIPKHKIIQDIALKQPMYADSNKSNVLIKKDILIVKKSVLENNLMKNKFKEFCNNIDIATNIDKFKKFIKENSYKILILDTNLPELNLKDISTLLLNSNENANINIKTVLITNNQNNIKEKYKNRFDKFIDENMEINQISIMLRNLIKG